MRLRWPALWLIRGGRTLREVAPMLGVDEASVSQWLSWYRAGGVDEVRRHRHGGRHGRLSLLTAAQQAQLTAQASRGAFRTAARPHGRAGAAVDRAAIRRALHPHEHLPAPAAPAHPHPSPPQAPAPPSREGVSRGPGGLETGGLGSALRAAGVRAEHWLGFADAMRLGLMGQVRRVWAPRVWAPRGRGVTVVQRLQVARHWRSLALAVNPARGARVWTGIANLQAVSVAEALTHGKTAGVPAAVWDRASRHRSGLGKEIGMPLVEPPPDAPAGPPAERVFPGAAPGGGSKASATSRWRPRSPPSTACWRR